MDAAGAVVLRELVAEGNDRTLEEFATLYAARCGVRPSKRALDRACRWLDLRRKKKEPGTRRANA